MRPSIFMKIQQSSKINIDLRFSKLCAADFVPHFNWNFPTLIPSSGQNCYE